MCGKDQPDSRLSSRSWPTRAVEAISSLGEPLGIFLVTRLALAFLAYTAQVLIPTNPAPGVWEGLTGHRLLDGWIRWDSGWYLLVASRGYDFGAESGLLHAPVLPLYPALISLLDLLPLIRLPVVALLVSNLAFAGALAVIYSLVYRKLDRAAAVRTALLLCLFPFSYFYTAAYADALTLLFVSVAFFSLERDGYLAAFALAALAALTTPAGLALWPALVYSCFILDRRSVVSLAGLGAFLAPTAVVAFGAYLYVDVGAPLAAIRSAILGPVRYGMIRDGLLPLNPLAFAFGSPELSLLAMLILGLLSLLTLRAASRLLGTPYAIFAFLVILRCFVGGLDALGRDLAVAFPVLVAIAWRLRTPQAESLALIVCVLFLGLFTALFASWYPTDRLLPEPSPSAGELRPGLIATDAGMRSLQDYRGEATVQGEQGVMRG